MAYEDAIEKQLVSMDERSVFDLCDRENIPPDAELGRLAFILSRKRSGAYKARLIYNGSKQRYRITDTYSTPTLSAVSLRIALAVAAERNFSFRTADVKTAFLYAQLPADAILYAEVPDGYPNAAELRKTKVIRLRQAIYGLKESPLLWYRHLLHYLQQNLQLHQSIYDECMLYNKDKTLFLLMYVDDLLLLGEPHRIHTATTLIQKKFTITSTEVNATVDFLGCNISRSDNGEYKLSQVTYLNNILTKYARTLDVQHTPLPVTNHTTELAELPVDTEYPYRQITGALGYLRYSRFDIVHALNVIARTNKYPTVHQVQQLQHLLGYLKKTEAQVLTFYGGSQTNNTLVALSDAEWAGRMSTRRSLGGSFVYYNRTCIAASCKTQTVTATAAASAELIEIYRTTKQLVHISGLLKEIGVQELTTVILTDSQSSVDTTKRAVTERSKHMAVYIHYIKEKLGKRFLVKHIPRQSNFADMLTKQSNKETFDRYWHAASTPFQWVHKLV